MPEFNHESTLYGETLVVRATTDSMTVSKEWTEHVYTLEENFERYHIQQRKWRIARGEETASDRRAEYFSDYQRALRRKKKPRRYFDV